MMGIKDRQFVPLPHLSLEELVPNDHLYRRLEKALDLSFVRDLARPLYAKGGRPSVDPVVFFKLQLVMFFEDLRSERQLMRVVADRLSLRWYLGYDLSEPLPDHSSLTRIRERFGVAVFRRFFERIVEMCFEAGLVRGEELFFDATKVEANASLDSARSRSLVEYRLGEHLVGMFPEDTSLAPDVGIAATDVEVGPAGEEERRELARTNVGRHRWIAENGRQERGVVRWGYKRMADLRVSTTDPDASPMHQKKKGGSSRLGYQTHYVVDGGKARVILDVLVTGAEVTENLPMLELLFRSRFRWRLRPRSVTGDAAYGTQENLVAIEKAGIRAYTALPEQGKRTSLFTKDAFVYDAEKDVYTCPAGETLRRQGHDRRRVREVRCEVVRLQRLSTQEQVHEKSEGALAESQPPRGVPPKGASVPRHRAVPQGPTQTRRVGRAALWGGQGVARFEEVQAQEAGEGERRGPDRGLGTEHKASTNVREPRTEKTGAGGCSVLPATAIAPPRPSGVQGWPSNVCTVPTAFLNKLGCSQTFGCRILASRPRRMARESPNPTWAQGDQRYMLWRCINLQRGD